MNTALLALAFVAAAAVVWRAGTTLTAAVSALDVRLGLGSALGGLILLSFATNLPEIAITVSAALSGNVDIAIANLIGGVAIQTVVLAVLDFRRRPGPNLTYIAANLTLVLEGVVVVAILVVVVAGTTLPSTFAVGPVSPASCAVVATWMVGVALVSRARGGLPWHADGAAPNTQTVPKGAGRLAAAPPTTEPTAVEDGPLWRPAALFAAAGTVTLGAGLVLERAGSHLASNLGMSGALFGATVLAASTAVPEIASGFAAVKVGDAQLAISDIFGGNAFLPVLFLVADLLYGAPVLPSADVGTVFLACLGAILTLIYVVGLVMRPQRRVMWMGVDSALVVFIYVVALGALPLVAAT